MFIRIPPVQYRSEVPQVKTFCRTDSGAKHAAFFMNSQGCGTDSGGQKIKLSAWMVHIEIYEYHGSHTWGMYNSDVMMASVPRMVDHSPVALGSRKDQEPTPSLSVSLPLAGLVGAGVDTVARYQYRSALLGRITARDRGLSRASRASSSYYYGVYIQGERKA
jgi:hypothetical protein